VIIGFLMPVNVRNIFARYYQLKFIIKIIFLLLTGFRRYTTDKLSKGESGITL